MVAHGVNPGLVRPGGRYNTDLLQFLEKNLKGEQPHNKYGNCTSFCELFFSTFPNIIERNVNIYWERIFGKLPKAENVTKKWAETTKIAKFTLTG
jgi:hypothetical protein